MIKSALLSRQTVSSVILQAEMKSIDLGMKDGINSLVLDHAN